MNRRQPLILVTEPAVVSSGLQPDRHTLFAPLWEVGENVRFYQGKVRRLVPAALAFQAQAGVKSRGLHQQQNSNGTRWIFTAVFDSGALKVYRWYGPAAELIDTLPGATVDQAFALLATYADFTTWGDWTILNSSVGAAQLFKATGDSAALANAPTDVVAFMKKQNQLFAIGHGPNKKQVSWSHADNINVWDPSDPAFPGNLSGTLPIEELDTGIHAAARLGQNIACYAEDQLALVYFVGLPAIYGQRVQLDGIGAVGKMAVCSDGRMNHGVSRNGIWRTDGSQFDYIDQGVLNEYLQANVNWDQASKIVASRNDVSRCFEFYFPMGSSLEVSEGWSHDPQTGGWSKLPAFQVVMERKLLDKPLGAKGGSVYLLDNAPTVSAPLSLRTKPLMAQAEGQALHMSSRMDEIELSAKAAIGVEFRYSVAEDIKGPWANSPWFTLHDDMRTYQTGPETPTGTFHRLEFRSVIASWDLDLQGFALFGEPDGTKREAL